MVLQSDSPEFPLYTHNRPYIKIQQNNFFQQSICLSSCMLSSIYPVSTALISFFVKKELSRYTPLYLRFPFLSPDTVDPPSMHSNHTASFHPALQESLRHRLSSHLEFPTRYLSSCALIFCHTHNTSSAHYII